MLVALNALPSRRANHMKTIDASVLLDLLTRPASMAPHKDILNDDLIAPDHVIAEVQNALKRMYVTKLISRARANEAANDFANIAIDFVSLHALQRDMWAMVGNVSPYDAAYLCVARLSNTPLITRDSRLARSAPSDITVTVLK
jgi:predicted nucleic acid-binding protein